MAAALRISGVLSRSLSNSNSLGPADDTCQDPKLDAAFSTTPSFEWASAGSRVANSLEASNSERSPTILKPSRSSIETKSDRVASFPTALTTKLTNLSLGVETNCLFTAEISPRGGFGLSIRAIKRLSIPFPQTVPRTLCDLPGKIQLTLFYGRFPMRSEAFKVEGIATSINLSRS